MILEMYNDFDWNTSLDNSKETNSYIFNIPEREISWSGLLKFNWISKVICCFLNFIFNPWWNLTSKLFDLDPFWRRFDFCQLFDFGWISWTYEYPIGLKIDIKTSYILYNTTQMIGLHFWNHFQKVSSLTTLFNFLGFLGWLLILGHYSSFFIIFPWLHVFEGLNPFGSQFHHADFLLKNRLFRYVWLFGQTSKSLTKVNNGKKLLIISFIINVWCIW